MLFTVFKSHLLGRHFDTAQNWMARFSFGRLRTSKIATGRILLPVLCSTGYLYFQRTRHARCEDTKGEVQKFQTRRDNMKL